MKGLSMHRAGAPEGTSVPALGAVDDERVAAHSVARLLITGPSRRGVETFARRIHGAGPHAPFPFLHKRACDLPIEPEALKEQCSRFMGAAAGGSILISDVEDMPAVVQEALIELLDKFESANRPSAAVRLMSGTTVSLFDRVVAGTFSARLFYRLNVIHLMVGPRSVARVADCQGT
jgi:DNA-binding NtrC family response regulator